MKKTSFICLFAVGFILTSAFIFTVNAEVNEPAKTSLGPPPVEMEEFHFLVGSWTLMSKRFSPDGTLTGQYKGKWDVQLLDEGRMIFDTVTWFNPDGTKESFYPTLRTFSPETKHWEMTYMSSLNFVHSQSFRGQFIDGEGHFNAIVSLTPEQSVMAKIRFYDIKKNSFEWSMKFSADGGEKWFLGEVITAKRVH